MARGHLLAAERGKRGQTYLLGCRNLSLVEIARMALDALGITSASWSPRSPPRTPWRAG